MDSSHAGGIIILLILLAVIGAGVFVFLQKRKAHAAKSPEQLAYESAEKDYNGRVREAEKALKVAESEHKKAVKVAEREVKRAQKDYEKRVKAAEKNLVEAQQMGDKAEQSIRGKEGVISYTRFEIVLPDRRVPLEPSIVGEVNTSGSISVSSRFSVGRTVGGAVLFGPVGAVVGAVARKNKTTDNRELFLMLEGSAFMAVLTLDPKKSSEARGFLAGLLDAAKNVEAMEAAKEAGIMEATHAVELVKMQTADVDAAQRGLAEMQINTQAIRQAQMNLDRVKAEGVGLMPPASGAQD